MKSIDQIESPGEHEGPFSREGANFFKAVNIPYGDSTDTLAANVIIQPACLYCLVSNNK